MIFRLHLILKIMDSSKGVSVYKAYLSTHWQAQKEAAHADDKSNFFPVGLKLFTPIVNDSSD